MGPGVDYGFKISEYQNAPSMSMSMNGSSNVAVPRTRSMNMSAVGQPIMSSSSQKYQPLANQVAQKRTPAGPTMMMSNHNRVSSSGSFKSSGIVPSVQNMSNQREMRKGTATMFAGGMPSSQGFTVKTYGSASPAPMRNYFDSQLTTTDRRREMKLMASFTVTLVTPDGEQQIECADDMYVIDAAEEAGIELPYSCRAGACSSCVGKVISGTLDNSDQNFLDEEQIKEGYILTCVAYPTSDCTIETDKEHDLF